MAVAEPRIETVAEHLAVSAAASPCPPTYRRGDRRNVAPGCALPPRLIDYRLP
jgi:hypothetical protein